MVDAAVREEAEAEVIAPSTRVLFAVGALLLFRWSLYSPVSTATSAELGARDNLRLLVDRSQAALRDKQYESALAPLDELTRMQPKNHVYWWQRALVLGALRRPREEVDVLEQFVKVSPLPGEACPRLPFLYTELGLKSEALDAFKRCSAFSPNDLQDAFYLGHAYERDGQIDRALEVYTEALKHGFNADVEAGLGRMLLRKGKAAAAYEAVAAALARNPHNVDVLLVAGIALSRQGKYAEAKVLLHRGVQRHDDTDLRYALGMIAELQGDAREAVTHYDAALRLDPGNKDAAARRSRFGAARK